MCIEATAELEGLPEDRTPEKKKRESNSWGGRVPGHFVSRRGASERQRASTGDVGGRYRLPIIKESLGEKTADPTMVLSVRRKKELRRRSKAREARSQEGVGVLTREKK